LNRSLMLIKQIQYLLNTHIVIILMPDHALTMDTTGRKKLSYEYDAVQRLTSCCWCWREMTLTFMMNLETE